MDPYKLIQKYYDTNSKLYHILINHSESVRKKALDLAKKHPELELDLDFINEAAMIHDIGIFETNAPGIQCFGKHEYIEHGYLGAEILREEGYPRHALVCERHTGTGLSLEHILKENLPLPHRELIPVSMEEQLICYADKFYSKSRLDEEETFDRLVRKMQKWGDDAVKKIIQWHNMFG